MRVHSGHPALQNGLLFGMILGIVEIVLFFLLGTLGFIINILLFLFVVGYAGYRASARTGKVSTGLVAGLLVGLLSSVIASIPLLIYYLSNTDSFRVQLQQQMAANNLYQGFTLTNNLVITSLILFLVVLVAGATLLGLGVGSIGGAIGKGQAPPPPVPPLSVSPAPPLPSFTVNELNVGHAIDNFFNNGGALPPAFVSLFNLTGNNRTTALDQLSGQAAGGVLGDGRRIGPGVTYAVYLHTDLDELPRAAGREGAIGLQRERGAALGLMTDGEDRRARVMNGQGGMEQLEVPIDPVGTEQHVEDRRGQPAAGDGERGHRGQRGCE